MSVPSPWTFARRPTLGRRVILLLALAALLYGFGLHAARACAPSAAAALAAIERTGGDPCHGEVDLAQSVCEAHCRTDAQAGRVSFSVDLPAALPLDPAPTLAPAGPIGPLALAAEPVRRDTGPPLHILLHRLLR